MRRSSPSAPPWLPPALVGLGLAALVTSAAFADDGGAPAQPIPPAAPAPSGLDAPSAEARIRAANALGDRGDAASFEPLIAALAHSPEPEVQGAILAALEKLNYSPAPLIEALRHHADPIARAYAAYTLGRMRAPQAFDALVAALDDPAAKVREQAILALGASGDLRAFEPLIKAAHKDSSPTLRASAEAQATALAGGSTHTFDEDSAIAQLSHPDPAQRREAADALGQQGSWWAVQPLVKALDDPDPIVRERAAAALGELGDKRAAKPLMDRIPERAGKERYLMISAVGILGDTGARAFLDPLLADPDPNTRRFTARALARVGDPASAPALTRAYEAEVLIDVRGELIHTLGVLGAPDALPTLVKAMGPQEELQVRCEAARGIANIPTKAAMDALVPALTNAEPLLRAAGADAVSSRGDAATREDVLKILEQMAKSEADPYVQETAIEALVVIKGRARREAAERAP